MRFVYMARTSRATPLSAKNSIYEKTSRPHHRFCLSAFFLRDRAYGADSSARRTDHCKPERICHSHALSTDRCNIAIVRSTNDHTDHINLHPNSRNRYTAPDARLHRDQPPATDPAIAIRADSIYAVRIT